jgi:hypothetical protein
MTARPSSQAVRRVIVLEEDLEIAPDFFQLFGACAPLLDDPAGLATGADNSFSRPALFVLCCMENHC